MSKKLALALGFALTVTALPAHAKAITITTSDLDLTTEAGMKKLDQRIRSAARKICGGEPVTGSRILPKASAECVKQTAAETRQKIAVSKAQAKG